RTSTGISPPDFESGASTDSATGARPRDHSGRWQRVNGATISVAYLVPADLLKCHRSDAKVSMADTFLLRSNVAETVRNRPITAAAAAIVIGGALAILGAWFFQYVLGLKPCPLCLEQ